MTRSLVLGCLVLCGAVSVGACSSSDSAWATSEGDARRDTPAYDEGTGAGSGSTDSPSAPSGGVSAGGTSGGTSSTTGPGPGQGDGGVTFGTLTAGLWDDNA